MLEDKDDTVDYNSREWALTALQQNDLDSIINKMNSLIDSEQLLSSTPKSG